MEQQVNANEVIKYLQQELTDKNLEVAILKAKLFDTKKDETKPEEKPAQGDEQQEGEN
jgi:hypothetical protein